MGVPAGLLTQRPVAHRGLHDIAARIVENTAPAVDAAVAAGYAIEVDVQASADGEAMVFHDFTLDRLTIAAGPVAALTAAALADLPFRIGAGRMIRLDQLFARIGGRVPLLVEIKSDFSGDMRLARRTAAVAATYSGPVALMSFDPAVLEAVRAVAPGLTRGIVAQYRYHGPDWPAFSAAQRLNLSTLAHWPRSRFGFIAYRLADLDRLPPRLARRLGLPVLTWTVRTGSDRIRATGRADQIIFEGFRP